MKCPNCGVELEAGKLYCEKCGQEIQIVPDYDPLDELVIVPEELKRDTGGKAAEPDAEKASVQNVPQKDEKVSETRQKEKRIWAKWFLLLGALAVCFCVFLVSYFFTARESSYSYHLHRGFRLIESESYEEAIPWLREARELMKETDGRSLELYLCLAQAYAHTENASLAVSSMEEAVSVGEKLSVDRKKLFEVYQTYMEILNLTGQTDEIENVIEECASEEIQEELLSYRIRKPACNMAEGTYSYYLRLELSAPYGRIYYTLDGTSPGAGSTLYEKPIVLQEEGETLLSAVAINDRGMISEPLVLVYKLHFSEE